MASPAGQFRPGRLIGIFLGVTALLYALVAFTPGSKSPKLGIDLQGGTQITITAKSANDSTPTAQQMSQSRSIIEARVNGQGVSGAQVRVEGNNQIAVSVPGQTKELGSLTRSAALNIRPQLDVYYDISSATSTDSSAAASSGVSGASAPSSPVATTQSALGDESDPTSAAASSSAPAGSSGAATTAAGSATGTGTVTKPSGAVIQNPPSAATSSGQGLRRAAPATSPAGSASSTPATASGSSDPAASSGGTSPAGTAVPSAVGSAAGASSVADSGAVLGTVVSGSAQVSGSAVPSAAATPALWPIAGSDPANPNQPAGADATAWTAWETAAKSAIETGGVKCSDIAKTEGLDDPAKPLMACSGGLEDAGNSTTPIKQVYLLDKTLIPGNQISQAAGVFDTSVSQWVINVSFNSTGFTTWANYTTNNIGKYTAFTLDGQVLSSPVINSAITTPVTQVSGSFTQASAGSLANALNFGALPLFFTAGQSTSVSATLGSTTLQAGLIAGGIGLLLVVVYCLIYYRLLGVITVLSLALSASLVYAIMTLLGRWISLSLDIAGIAGLIVAIGITADSFVIYFERLKDEVREGRSFRSAVPRGWERARRTILSADAVSFLSAVVLYLIATGDVKGFAFTLGLSTVLDLVVVFLVTHPLIALASGSPVFQSPRYSGLGAVARAGAEHRAATARLQLKEA